jgi:hypothetical protein
MAVDLAGLLRWLLVVLLVADCNGRLFDFVTCARWPWAAGWRDYNGSRPGRLAEANRRLLRLQRQTLRPAAPILSLRGFVQDVANRRDCNGRRPGQITETDLVAGDCNGRLRDQRHLFITLSQLHLLHHLRLLSAFDHFPSLRDDSLLFLMLCSSSPSLRSSTSTLFDFDTLRHLRSPPLAG